MNKRKIIQRMLSLPFIAVLFLIPSIVGYFKLMRLWFLYGGEIIPYQFKDERNSIAEMYSLLKDKKLN